MIRCEFNECRYPECNFTCEMDTDDIILMLEQRIAELLQEKEETRKMLRELRISTNRLANSLSAQCDEDVACAKACLHGYTDCIHNPEYLRRWHTDYWKKLGMPTSCDPNECYYDDEDK